MIAKKVQFTMVFGQMLDGFAMAPDAIEYYPGCTPPDFSAAPKGAPVGAGPARPDQEFELTITEQDGQLKGILKTEHGCQKIDDLVESPFSLSFTAFAGSEGVELFRYVLMFSDSTAQLVGFTCGIKPFFRSFMPLRGTIIE
jgi:hypothetical protein